jgi:hypothetical protein
LLPVVVEMLQVTAVAVAALALVDIKLLLAFLYHLVHQLL